jgi:hypothetical protein
MRRILIASLMLLAATAVARAADAPARVAGLINDPQLAEISGLAASRRHPGVLYVHNDSGDPAAIYAISESGERLATLSIAGVTHIDWEDIAAFTLKGKHYLLIADTGDNGGIRQTLQLHVLPEPERIADQSLAPAWSIAFRWPDGPRDCEAVAVDAARGQVLLVGKKRVPPDLLTLRLHPRTQKPQVARRVGSLAGISQPTQEDLTLNPIYGRYRSQITAADVSPDGHRLAVLNYRTAYVFARPGKTTWAQAVARPGTELHYPWLAQAEALGWSLDGKALWISSERRPTPLMWVASP